MEPTIREKLVERLAHNFSSMVSHPDGWNDIVQKLHEDIVEIDQDYKVVQTKEKFGGLRFYIHISEDVSDADGKRIWSLIREAEEASYQTCENCGNPGIKRNMHWTRTLCDQCFEQHTIEFTYSE